MSKIHPLAVTPTPHLLFSAQLLSHVRLFATLWTVAGQTPLSMGLSGKNTEVGCHFPSPGDLPQPETEPTPPLSPALQKILYLLTHQGSPDLPVLCCA